MEQKKDRLEACLHLHDHSVMRSADFYCRRYEFLSLKNSTELLVGFFGIKII